MEIFLHNILLREKEINKFIESKYVSFIEKRVMYIIVNILKNWTEKKNWDDWLYKIYNI